MKYPSIQKLSSAPKLAKIVLSIFVLAFAGSPLSAAVGDLYQADFVGNNAGTVIKVSPTGVKTVFAAGLNMPFGVAVDVNDNLFEADEGSGSIFKFTPTGTKTTFATGVSGPAGLAFDQSGNLFVSNFNAGRIAY